MVNKLTGVLKPASLRASAVLLALRGSDKAG